MKPFEVKQTEKMKLGIAREAELRHSGEMDADLYYKLATIENIQSPFLVQLRLAMVSVETEGNLASLLGYATHATGVILRAYDSTAFRNKENKIVVMPTAKSKGIMEILVDDKVCSVVGVNQSKECIASHDTKDLLIEASYINPDTLVEAVSTASLKTDDLYYKTSRGSNPELEFGLSLLASLLDSYSDVSCYEGSLNVNIERENETVIVDAKEISSIIGMDVELSKIVTILQKLGFELSKMGEDTVAAIVPLFRHDIKHIQDVAEEIVRIIGINNIEAKPFVFAEQARLNDTTDRYKAKKEFKNRAVGAGYYENVSYVFSDKTLLEKYGFPVTEAGIGTC